MVEETDGIYYDEEKAIDYILSNMPDLDCRRDDILSVIDSIFDFYDSKGLLDFDNLDSDGDFTEDEILSFVNNSLRKKKICVFNDDGILARIVRLELEYEDSVNL